MRRWFRFLYGGSSVRRFLIGLLLLGALLAAAKLHACACTGGQGTWRKVGQGAPLRSLDYLAGVRSS